nr:hypothetical protein [Plasticicumulans sp.]
MTETPDDAGLAGRLAGLLPGALGGWLPAPVLADWAALATLNRTLAGLEDSEARAEAIAALPPALA